MAHKVYSNQKYELNTSKLHKLYQKIIYGFGFSKDSSHFEWLNDPTKNFYTTGFLGAWKIPFIGIKIKFYKIMVTVLI